ncbi:AIR synthase-related protein [Flaviaesturariibacter aridisoli]|uniref:Phosphoribosylformylglycinamidine cyclo-ligase n=1 Tax=Flaviaesturariibacter aridisoli TaxID=2545761 RepID=A0A4R4E762_9BACT|nr:AIR synthase-related protein [Flaviaesturariibacter aridisoli]TCZ73871.1 phosphoribosylformylglycinamidine cyclo-ligase [Flaviaesturariibacter aridisoli]
MSLYSQRGVSAQKEDVHAATRNLSKGLYPRAFCKIDPDLLGGDADWVNVMHADGAGTKSILAYLYWKETGDLSVWKGIAQDAIVMNLDDMICTGIYDRMLYSSSIDRNKNRIPGEVLTALIEGTQEFLDGMAALGVHIAFLGGETADVGDAVRTVTVNGTMAARWRRHALITNERIAPGQVIVGLASHGQATYETGYNSGIGSNGLTSARHDVLHKHYKTFPETFDETLSEEVIYIGKHRLTDSIDAAGALRSVGGLLLSPTRTFAPVVRTLIEAHFEDIYGIIHCSGGGQTKCFKYMPDGLRVVKDNLPAPPEIFRLIQTSSGADNREMYQVFNMGTRLEVYTNERVAVALVAIARHYGIDAQVIGRTEESVKKELVLQVAGTEIRY